MTWHDGCPLGWLWTHKPGSTEGWASGVLADDEGERSLPRHGVWSCSSACVFSYKTLPSITNQQRNNGSVLWFTRSCMDFPDSPKLVWRQHWLFYVLSHVWILTTSEHLPFSRQKCQRGRNLWTSHPGTEWDLEPKFSKKKKKSWSELQDGNLSLCPFLWWALEEPQDGFSCALAHQATVSAAEGGSVPFSPALAFLI